MTTSLQDISNYSGRPVVLYEFSRTSKSTMTGVSLTTYYRYTSSDRDWTDADDNIWKATAISDDGVKQSGDTQNDQLIITMPYTEAVPQMFAGSPPSDPINLIIRQADVGESDVFIAWVGIVGMVARSPEVTSGGSQVVNAGPVSAQAQVVCSTVASTMDRAGLRLSWSRGCPHDLYGGECRAIPTRFVVSGLITALDGVSLVVDETIGIGPMTSGPINAIRINNHGGMYADHDTGLISTGAGDATYEVLTVDVSTGAVETFTFTVGTGYATNSNVATSVFGAQPGIGTGLTFDIDVTLIDGSPTFDGGFIEWIGEDGHANRLGLVGFDNPTGRLTVLGQTDKLAVGTLVHCFLGCNHTRTMCQATFDNLVNHGGHDYMPLKNPFNGDLIF